MVEYTLRLDSIFGSLADSTRRDILKRVAQKELTVSEIAGPYDLTFAAISKHLKVLAEARLVRKRRQGKQQFVQLSPVALEDATDFLQHYQAIWKERFDSLDQYLNLNKKK